MSYEIEYRGDVYVRRTSSSEPYYLLTVVVGPNNVFEGRRRVRDEYVICYGWNYSIIKEVCKHAGNCEGGSLQVNGKHITPENYLKRYRDKIRNAKPISTFFASRRTARFEVVSNPGEWQKSIIDKYKDYLFEEPDPYHPEVNVTWCEILIGSEDDFEKFLELKSISKYDYVRLKSSGDVIEEVVVSEVEIREKQLGLGGGEEWIKTNG